MTAACSWPGSASLKTTLNPDTDDSLATGKQLVLVGLFAAASLTAGVAELRPVFVFVCLVLGFLVWHHSRSTDLRISEVIFLAVLFRLLFLPLLPSLSDDGYRYLWDGMLVWNGFNPFSQVPSDPALSDFHHLALYERLNSQDVFTVYPPVSQIVFGMWGWIPADRWPVSFILTKVTVVGIEMGGLLILARLVKPSLLILYAWNPVVVIETAGQLHTEPLMASLLIGTIYWFRSGRPAASTVALTAAGWVKLYPLLFLPFLFRRIGWKWSWLAVTVSLVLLTPYVELSAADGVIDALGLYVHFFEFYSAPYLILKALAYKLDLFSSVEATVGLSLMSVFAIYVFWLYIEDRRGSRSWTLSTVVALTLAGWYVTSTTVHPWYFLGLLAVLPVSSMSRPPWLWLAGVSLGTYLLYTDDVYWPFVWLGWGGWLVLSLRTSQSVAHVLDKIVEEALRRRARVKVRLLRKHLRDEVSELDRPLSVLDLGAGEGFVGEALQAATHSSVTLCDVRPSNRTNLPFVLYDGRELPFGSGWFDTTILIYTLHHCEDHVQVLKEARRVTSGRLVILESVFQSEAGRRLLDFLDRLANRWRSNGEMAVDHHYRKTNDWVELLETMGFEVQSVRTWGTFHRKALIVVDS